MIAQETSVDIQEPMTLEQRRAFHRLPLAERRRLLAKQAEQVVALYADESATKEREEWQGGDLVEY